MTHIIQQNININIDYSLNELLNGIIDSFKKIVSIQHYINFDDYSQQLKNFGDLYILIKV